MDSLLKIESLKKYYGKKPNQTKALDGISFQVMPGEFLGIMGSSGSGKSTLLNCIATVIKPDSGTIELQGKEIQEHLQVLAVKQVGIGEILAAGLVVDDAEVGRAILFVGVHAVDLAGEQTVAAGGMVDDGRHLAAGGEGQLLRRGGEL